MSSALSSADVSVIVSAQDMGYIYIYILYTHMDNHLLFSLDFTARNYYKKKANVANQKL